MPFHQDSICFGIVLHCNELLRIHAVYRCCARAYPNIWETFSMLASELAFNRYRNCQLEEFLLPGKSPIQSMQGIVLHKLQICSNWMSKEEINVWYDQDLQSRCKNKAMYQAVRILIRVNYSVRSWFSLTINACLFIELCWSGTFMASLRLAVSSHSLAVFSMIGTTQVS